MPAMAKIDDIPSMTLGQLRPYILRAMGRIDWTGSDWDLVGIIFNEVGIQINRSASPPHSFSVVVMGKTIAGGIGTGADVDPVVAIFRAYLMWRSYQANALNPSVP